MKKRPVIPRDLVRHLEWSLDDKPIVTTSTSGTGSSSSFSLSDEADFWRIAGVPYRGNFETVDLSKSLLDGATAYTQSEWATHYNSAISTNGFYTPDFPLLCGIVKALYGAHDTVAETATVQNFLRTETRAKWLMTLSRILYQPTGNDLIVHNHGTPDEYKIEVDFITPDEKIIDASKPASYQALLGTEDSVQNINQVFQWLNGTDTFAWKKNSKPQALDERVAGFDANSGRAVLDCNRDPSVRFRSLGVRAIRRASAASGDYS